MEQPHHISSNLLDQTSIHKIWHTSTYHIYNFNSSGAKIIKYCVPRTLKLLLLTILILLCSGCINDDDEFDDPDFRYRIGDVEAILTGGEQNNIYKGMIYEYGVGDIEIDLQKAKEYYTKIKNKKLSAKRNFLLCYLYCVDDIGDYFEETKGEFISVNLLFALSNILAGEKCHQYVDEESCSLAKRLASTLKGQDIYYEAGILLYEKAKRSRHSIEPFKFFEMPYYFIMKSYVEGNEQALNYLSALSRTQSWVPIKQSPNN